MIRPEIDSNAIKRLQAELKAIDPGLQRQLTKDLKAELSPVASQIQRYIPTEAPMSGMKNNGRLGFARLRVKVSVTPNARWGRPFARFILDGRSEANQKMIEFAGKRGSGKTAQGKWMIHQLDMYSHAGNSKTGRFFFEGYKRSKGSLYGGVQNILDRYAAIVNRKFNG
jgi:hypothetical protein